MGIEKIPRLGSQKVDTFLYTASPGWATLQPRTPARSCNPATWGALLRLEKNQDFAQRKSLSTHDRPTTMYFLLKLIYVEEERDNKISRSPSLVQKPIRRYKF